MNEQAKRENERDEEIRKERGEVSIGILSLEREKAREQHERSARWLGEQGASPEAYNIIPVSHEHTQQQRMMHEKAMAPSTLTPHTTGGLGRVSRGWVPDDEPAWTGIYT